MRTTVALLLLLVSCAEAFALHSPTQQRRPLSPAAAFLPTLLLPSSKSVLVPSKRVACVGGGIVSLAVYHLVLLTSKRPNWKTVQADTRHAWATHVHETEGWLYAVQTMRNAITACTFLSTTVLSLLTVITGKLLQQTESSIYGRLRFTILALTMLISAFEFLQSARLLTHAGFMFPVVASETVAVLLRKSSIAQWLGLRWLYLSVAGSVWLLAGEIPFLWTSLLLVVFFRSIDQAPME